MRTDLKEKKTQRQTQSIKRKIRTRAWYLSCMAKLNRKLAAQQNQNENYKLGSVYQLKYLLMRTRWSWQTTPSHMRARKNTHVANLFKQSQKKS